MAIRTRKLISMEEIGMAYRKAKVDLYYSSDPDLIALLLYEENLHENLDNLRKKLRDADHEWFASNAFLGEWLAVPKAIEPRGHRNTLISSDPWKQWESICQEEGKKNKKPKAEFRLMAKASIDFHVLSALWMAKVGHKYEATLDDCAYGNRLRRKKDESINPFSLGSFQPYLYPYRKWRDNGIRAMRGALDEGKRVISITADVSSFYHELNPDFMLNETFQELIGLDLQPAEKRLNRIFITALKNWAQSTPLKKGLPVGLPASGVVANMAMVELDRRIKEQVVPLYYGRYVDDILLVMENGSDFGTAEEVWEWIFQRMGGLLRWKSKKRDSVAYTPSYLADSNIEFINNKNKVFLLEGTHGKTLLDALIHQISERSSEWRSLPALPRNPEHIATKLLTASQCDGEAADNLRKADVLSMRRADFALKLRDFEAYERDLPPDAWKPQRHAFLNAFIEHVLVLPAFFDLAQYLPRVLKLATASEDFVQLNAIVERVEGLVEIVGKDCTVSLKGCLDTAVLKKDVLKRWSDHVVQVKETCVIASFPVRLSGEGKRQCAELIDNDSREIQQWHHRLFSHDLAHIPFRFSGLPREVIGRRGISARKSFAYCEEAPLLLPGKVAGSLPGIARRMKCSREGAVPYGLAFPTRPFNMHEFYMLHPDPYSESGKQQLDNWIFALRGFSATDKLPYWSMQKDVLNVVINDAAGKPKIAVASWKTEMDSWNASVLKKADPDGARYQRLADLLNSVMHSSIKLDYLILPELSVPPRWFLRLALGLKKRRISLICGVEYLHRTNNRVSNQVWAALSHDGLGFPSMMVYRQDKQRAALHEESALFKLAGVAIDPVRKWNVPPVIKHGDFHFAMLICSELTNIAYRTALRGKVDALFVPEWNPDTEGFNALVESSALDIHAYIIQCNDRQYGDSRIRAPYKDPWLRDLVRLKGGLNDYFVVGEIDVDALRQFQSQHRSPPGPFKPVPDGFLDDMADERKVLPRGKKSDG